MAANTNKGFGLLFEMGCGKTRTAIAIAGAAYEKGAIQRVLVIAPTSVVSVWPKEIAEVADFKVTCKALLGTKQQRIRMIEDLQAFPFKALKVAVINYESTWRDGLFEKIQEYDADLIICDESQRIKTHDAEQSKAIHQITRTYRTSHRPTIYSESAASASKMERKYISTRTRQTRSMATA